MPMPRHGFAWHTVGAKAASVPSPIERNAGSCRADPTRSARWPARVNLAAFWQQIVPIVPFLPTLPTAKYCTVCYLQIAAHPDTEEVAGSNQVVPTIFINNIYASPFSRFVAFLSQTPKPPHEQALKLLFPRSKCKAAPEEMLCQARQLIEKKSDISAS